MPTRERMKRTLQVTSSEQTKRAKMGQPSTVTHIKTSTQRGGSISLSGRYSSRARHLTIFSKQMSHTLTIPCVTCLGFFLSIKCVTHPYYNEPLAADSYCPPRATGVAQHFGRSISWRAPTFFFSISYSFWYLFRLLKKMFP